MSICVFYFFLFSRTLKFTMSICAFVYLCISYLPLCRTLKLAMSKHGTSRSWDNRRRNGNKILGNAVKIILHIISSMIVFCLKNYIICVWELSLLIEQHFSTYKLFLTRVSNFWRRELPPQQFHTGVTSLHPILFQELQKETWSFISCIYLQ